MYEIDNKCDREQVTLAEHVAGLEANGARRVPAASHTYWVDLDCRALMRLPAFNCDPVTTDEIRRGLWSGRVPLLSYLRKPDDRHGANAWLYVASDNSYSVDKLAPPVRRNVRRGARELRIEWLTSDQFRRHGLQPFCDTRKRNGLSNRTAEGFLRHFAHRIECPGHAFLGAWKGESLAAVLPIVCVDDWAEFDGCLSCDAFLRLRPNETILVHALEHFLVRKNLRLVSYGASSIQASSNTAGLHYFKKKLGFRAEPVHRAFVLHPVLRSFANRATLLAVHSLLRVKRRNLLLRKIEGILSSVLDQPTLSDVELETEAA